jgi:acetyl esterase/lipase
MCDQENQIRPEKKGTGISMSILPVTPRYKDLAYASLSEAEKLDIYLPDGSGPFPLVVSVHGGAFMMGDKRDEFAVVGFDQLLEAGYALASINYRLSGEAKAPAQIQDVKAAVRWLRAHARDYHLKPEKIAAWGASAGGNLAALLGVSCSVAALEGTELGNTDQSSCVQAVIDWFGPTDFLQMDNQLTGRDCPQTHNDPDSPESRLVGAPIQLCPDLVKAANPITYVTAFAPPFLIMHGTEDCTVPPQQSQLLYDALLPAIGADKVTLVFLNSARHGGPQFSEESSMQRVIKFLDRHIK